MYVCMYVCLTQFIFISVFKQEPRSEKLVQESNNSLVGETNMYPVF